MNQNKFLKAIIYLFFIPAICINLIFSGCSGRKTKCPGFRTEILSWIPDKLNDTVVLYNGDTSRKLIVRQSVVYHTDFIRSNSDCSCMDEYFVKMQDGLTTLTFEFPDPNDPARSFAHTDNGILHADSVHLHATLNGVIYDSVIIYNNVPPTSCRYQQIIISRSKGIIGITENNKLWTIHEKASGEKKISDTQYREDGC